MWASMDYGRIAFHWNVTLFLQLFCCVMLHFEWIVKCEVWEWLLRNQLAIMIVFAMWMSGSVCLSDFSSLFGNYTWRNFSCVVESNSHIVESVSVTTDTPVARVLWKSISRSVRSMCIKPDEKCTMCVNISVIGSTTQDVIRESEWKNTKTSAIKKLDSWWA